MQALLTFIRNFGREASIGEGTMVEEQLKACLAHHQKNLKRPLRLRFATEADVEAIVALERLAYDGYEAWSKEDFLYDLQSNPYRVYFLLEDRHQLLAMASGRFRYREAHLSHLMVHPAYQGQGWGRYLMKLFQAAVRELGVGKLSLEVQGSNWPAQSLYQDLGFRLLSHIPDYYPDGEAALYLIWEPEND